MAIGTLGVPLASELPEDSAPGVLIDFVGEAFDAVRACRRNIPLVYCRPASPTSKSQARRASKTTWSSVLRHEPRRQLDDSRVTMRALKGAGMRRQILERHHRLSRRAQRHRAKFGALITNGWESTFRHGREVVEQDRTTKSLSGQTATTPVSTRSVRYVGRKLELTVKSSPAATRPARSSTVSGKQQPADSTYGGRPGCNCRVKNQIASKSIAFSEPSPRSERDFWRFSGDSEYFLCGLSC